MDKPSDNYSYNPSLKEVGTKMYTDFRDSFKNGLTKVKKLNRQELKEYGWPGFKVGFLTVNGMLHFFPFWVRISDKLREHYLPKEKVETTEITDPSTEIERILKVYTTNYTVTGEDLGVISGLTLSLSAYFVLFYKGYHGALAIPVATNLCSFVYERYQKSREGIIASKKQEVQSGLEAIVSKPNGTL